MCLLALNIDERKEIEKGGWLGENVQQSAQPNFVGFIESESEESEDSAIYDHDKSDSDSETERNAAKNSKRKALKHEVRESPEKKRKTWRVKYDDKEGDN